MWLSQNLLMAGVAGPQTFTSEIVFVGQRTNTFANATSQLSLTSLTGGIASEPSPGDLVVFFYGVSSSGQTPTLGVPGYTELCPVVFNNRAYEASLFGGYKFMGAVPDASVVYTVDGISTGLSSRYVTAYVFRNIHTDSPESAAAVPRNLNTRVNPSPITPGYSNSLVIASGIIAANSSSLLTSPDLTSFVSAVNADNDSISGGTGFVFSSTTFDPGLFGGGPTNLTENAAASITAAFRPAVYPKAAEIELSLESDTWVGIDGTLRFLRPDGTDCLASATYVTGSFTNDFSSISPGEFTTNSGYATAPDPRTGRLWSSSAGAGGLKIFYKPAEPEAVSAVELVLRSEATYGIPTPRIFLDGVEEVVSGLLGDATLRKATVLY